MLDMHPSRISNNYFILLFMIANHIIFFDIIFKNIDIFKTKLLRYYFY